MPEIDTDGSHYKALAYIKKKGGNISKIELLDFRKEKNLEFKIDILKHIGYLRIEKERVYLTEDGRKRLMEN